MEYGTQMVVLHMVQLEVLEKWRLQTLKEIW